jgi:hypothetical protein
VDYPLEDISREVINLLQSRLEGSYDGAPRRIEVRSKLVLRDSTAAPSIEPLFKEADSAVVPSTMDVDASPNRRVSKTTRRSVISC